MTMQKILVIASIVAFAGGALFGMLPLGSSSTLPQESVQRRCYWGGTAVGATLLFLSQLPNWRGGLFVATMLALAMFTTAGRYTGHVKIGGRVYSSGMFDRRSARRDGD
ncbi:MAG: hypothetical protein KIH64_011665 [Mycobacterium sp.]|nr:hypothetical protein [Mycobacterium sp.]